jgi:hypothetical protein
MNVVQIRDRRPDMLRGRHAAVGAAAPSGDVAAWPVCASEEIALDYYLQQASYDVAFDELFEAEAALDTGQESYAIRSRCALSTPAREKGRR